MSQELKPTDSFLSFSQIFTLFSRLPTFLEPLDNNRAEDIEDIRAGRWRLKKTKIVAKKGI